jgi:flavodoxin
VKVLIVYYSATGNTKYGTALIKHGLEQAGGNHCDCVEIKNFSPDMIQDYDLIGFACPVFAYKPPLNMLELIRSLPDGKQKPCFTFNSYAGELSNTFWIMKTELEKRHYKCIAQKAMLAQGAWTTGRSPGNINYADEPSAATQAEVIEFGQSLPGLFDRSQYEGLVAADQVFISESGISFHIFILIPY